MTKLVLATLVLVSQASLAFAGPGFDFNKNKSTYLAAVSKQMVEAGINPVGKRISIKQGGAQFTNSEAVAAASSLHGDQNTTVFATLFMNSVADDKLLISCKDVELTVSVSNYAEIRGVSIKGCAIGSTN